MTVEAILQAAEEVLVDKGYAAATTNRIAARAGVSIGSLYQYFSGKDAVFSELLTRHHRERQVVIDKLRAELKDPGRPLAPALTEFFGGMARLHGDKPRLDRALLEQLPHSHEREARHQEEMRAHTQEIEAVLRRRPEVRVADPAVAAHLVIQTLGSLTRWLGHEAPASLDPDKVAAEAVAMLMAYLCPTG